jgi:hypothetical protein
MPERGADLSARFYRELVAPLLQASAPDLAHAAARLGSGSDVLGLDDERSADHDFGCRLNLLLDEEAAAFIDPVRASLEESLPDSFGGWPVRFAVSWRPTMAVNVDVATVGHFAAGRLGVDPIDPLDIEDWLCLTGQSVLEVVAGPVFHDDTRQLSAVRERLAWYPEDLWLYVLSAGWARLGQELPLVGRAGERGDEAGSKVIAARLARDIIHLSFLVERRWPPYPKWAGTGLRQLPGGPAMADQLDGALSSTGWQERQGSLAAAIEQLADRQASLGMPSARPAVTAFFDRPFLTPDGAIHQALWDTIAAEEVRRLPKGVGSVEQWSDNVDVLSHPGRRMALRSIYRQWSAQVAPVGTS